MEYAGYTYFMHAGIFFGKVLAEFNAKKDRAGRKKMLNNYLTK